jgi:hypothetical protein
MRFSPGPRTLVTNLQLFPGAGELDAKRELFEVPHHDGH